MPEGYVHPEYLVETDWLAAHLADPKLVVQSPAAPVGDPVETPYKHLRPGICLRPLGPGRR
jgi:hypothetical protein